jgi:two-component system cell cycle sensor histidine kinase/response regulator CckA
MDEQPFRGLDFAGAAVDGAGMAAWSWDLRTGRLRWAEGVRRLFGMSPDEEVGTLDAYVERTHPDDRAALRDAIRRVIDIPGSAYEVEHRVVWSDGTVRWLRSKGRVERDTDGRPLEARGVAWDVTESTKAELERRETEQRLRESEERFRTLVEQAEDAIFLADETTRYIDANPAACQMLGYTLEELCQLRIQDIYDPDEVSTKLPTRMRGLMSTGTTAGERRLRRKDGTLVHVELSGRRMTNGKLQAIVRDVTERRQLEAQLLLADRMASLGRLAAGAAHEINNPLAYVVLSLELIARRVEQAQGALAGAALDSVGEAAAQAREGAERVRQIVRTLGSFSRGDESPVGAVDVGRAFDAALDIASSKIRHRARLTKDYRATRLARVNEFRLGQVLVNLLVNAADAIPEEAPDENTVTLRTYSDDGRVWLEVSDTGSGIEPEIVGHIFDPFFTSKPIGMGTGLGLAICHSIVTTYGGEISVDSRVGRGTTMRLWLPVAQHAEEQAGASAPSTVGRARVLVVDDEPRIGRTIGQALTRHDVTVTASAREALELCRRETFDCVVSDLMMADMSGMDLYEALAREPGGLERRVVFITGGTVTERSREFVERVSNRCLEKPFELAALEDAVERTIREQRS